MAGTKASGRPSNKAQIKIKGQQSPPTDIPDGLNADGMAVWELAVESLPHVLRPVDGPVLHLACLAFQSAIQAYESGDQKEGTTQARTYLAIADKLGLHPASRNIVRPADEPKGGEDDDIVARLLARGGLN
jgi:phage terminase small subunit